MRALYERTDGVPLFIASVTRDVIARGAQAQGQVGDAAQFVASTVPDNLAAIIDHYMAQLGDERRRLLAAAAVCGIEFGTDTLSRVLGREVIGVAEVCDQLVREQVWLIAPHAGDSGDPLVAPYAFRHGLFREVLYARTPPSRQPPLKKIALRKPLCSSLENEQHPEFNQSAGLPIETLEAHGEREPATVRVEPFEALTARRLTPDDASMDTVPPTSLDESRLSRYLEAYVPGFKGPLTAKKFAGGQSNPTYLIDSASGKYVLRRKPTGPVLKSAHAVDREFRVISALAATDVPVPRAVHLCTDDAVIGSMFYLMSFVDGRIFWDAALPELPREDRPAVYDAINRSLAALHSVNLEAVGLSDYGKPGNYFERQIALWTRQYQLSATEDIPEMNQLIERLPALTPEDDGRVCLLHGDYRLDNMIFRRDAPEVAALIDWELSTLGHPMADLAYYCMSLRMPGHGDMRGLAGLDRKALNIPSEEAFIERYCERTGLGGIDHWPFYLAFSYFRLAAIVQGVKKRALDGNASSQRALEVGRMTRPMAEMAVAALEADLQAPGS